MGGRIMVGFAIAIAGYFGINPPGFVAQVVAFAFGGDAASFFPVIILGIFDGRTHGEGAIAGMIAGLAFTAYDMIAVNFYGMEPWLFGISAEGIGTIAMIINFAVTLIVSPLTPPPPLEIQTLLENLPTLENEPPALEEMDEEY